MLRNENEGQPRSGAGGIDENCRVKSWRATVENEAYRPAEFVGFDNDGIGIMQTIFSCGAFSYVVLQDFRRIRNKHMDFPFIPFLSGINCDRACLRENASQGEKFFSP